MIQFLRQKCCCGSSDLGCATTFPCGGHPVPRYLLIDWGTVDQGESGECPDCCYWISQIRLLMHQGPDCSGDIVANNPCQYYGAMPLAECNRPATITNALCDGVNAFDPILGPSIGPTTEASVSTDGTTINISLAVYCIESVSGAGGVNPGGAATYSGSGDDDGSAVTLTRLTGSGDCTMPETITVTPVDQMTAKLLAGCLCSPLLVPESEDAVLSLDFSIGGGTGRACLTGLQDPDTLLWSWTGSGVVELGTCDGETLAFEIYLDTSALDPDADEQECEWKLKITDASLNVEELPIEVTTGTPVSISASGTLTTICGGGAFASFGEEFTGVFDPGEHPYVDHCPNIDLGMLCQIHDRQVVSGELIESFPGSCSGSTCTMLSTTLELTTGAILCSGSPIAPGGFSDSDNYFRGPFPIDDNASSADYELLIYYNGSGLSYAILDQFGCVLDSGGVTSFDCETLTGHIDTAIPPDNCCAAGTLRVNIG